MHIIKSFLDKKPTNNLRVLGFHPAFTSRGNKIEVQNEHYFIGFSPPCTWMQPGGVQEAKTPLPTT